MAKANTEPLTAYCRACQARIRFGQLPELCDIVSCPECDRQFEVVKLAPIQLEWLADADDGSTFDV